METEMNEHEGHGWAEHQRKRRMIGKMHNGHDVSNWLNDWLKD